MNFIDILEEERELNKQIDTISDRIVHILHTIEDMEMYPERFKFSPTTNIESEQKLLEECRAVKESLKQRLKTNHVKLRYHLTRLFQEADNT